MKRPSLSLVALIILLGALIFSEVKNTVTGDKQFFILSLLFRDPNYAEKIVIKPYLLTDKQTIYWLSHPEEEIQQPRNRELFLKNLNVVLRIRNDGDAVAWGTLAYSLDNTNWWKIDLRVAPIRPEDTTSFHEFVIPMGRVGFYKNDELPEAIQFRWIALYSK